MYIIIITNNIISRLGLGLRAAPASASALANTMSHTSNVYM